MHPKRAYILPPVLNLPAFAISVSGFDGTLTLSTGIIDNNPLVKRFLDDVVEQLITL
jgi:NRPS condensation-like uncharacterized protein